MQEGRTAVVWVVAPVIPVLRGEGNLSEVQREVLPCGGLECQGRYVNKMMQKEK